MERCLIHGSEMRNPGSCETTTVLRKVADERARQFERYGTNEENANGTGPTVPWLHPFSVRSAVQIEEGFRRYYDEHERAGGRVTWVDLLREEFAEVVMESDPEKLEAELIQVAALAVSWVENLRRERRITRSSEPSDSGS